MSLDASQSDASDNQEPAILLRGVVKRFGALTAVDGLDLDVPPGIVMGLLGPNGAGKSTSMRMLTAQSRADEGEIRILGHQVPRQSKWARSRMGVVPQHDNLDEELTVAENLRVYTYLYRVPRSQRRLAEERALEIAHLQHKRDTITEKLSGGMRRRLLIARALVHRPEVVLLDEPTVGLDPQVRQELWGLITALRDEGVTVLMSTHYIEEAERLSDEVALMARGKVVERGVPAELITTYAGKTVEEFPAGPDTINRLEERTRAAGLRTRRTGSALAVMGAEDIADDLREELGPAARRGSNLEDVFVALTGEQVE